MCEIGFGGDFRRETHHHDDGRSQHKRNRNYFFLAVFAAGFLAGAFLAAAFTGFLVAIKTPCYTFFGIIAV